jgi:hypothetical protein
MLNVVDESPRVCWVCHEPVPLETLRDSFGFFAHEECLKAAVKKEIKKRA